MSADFTLPGSQPAALLLHGYLGSPAEMRPLAEALHGCGWTVRGLQLPGFGADARTLSQRRAEDWLSTAGAALQDLAQDHHPLILVGHSMGAAVSMSIMEHADVAGLVVLAPFWRLANPVWSLLPLLRRTNVSIHLFPWLKLLYREAAAHLTLHKYMPWIDLDDPAGRKELRRFRLDLGGFDEIRRLGLGAWRAAAHLHAPILAIQGRADWLAHRTMTRSLLSRYAGPIHYREIDGGHELIDSSRPTWRWVRSLVLAFGHRLALQSASEISNCL